MSYVNLWVQKVWCAGSQMRSINNWRGNSGFEGARSSQVIGNKSNGEIMSVARRIMRVGELMITTFAGNRIEMH